jgi:ABC-2 type transport system ATP-binding protein
MDNLAVETINLTKRFGSKVAVDRVCLRVGEGEFYGFLGPNGAGKSTTINMLVGLLRPDGGSARIHGIDIGKNPFEAKRLMGVVPESTNLYPRLTGREFIRFSASMYGVDRAEADRRTTELLELLDLASDADKMIVDYSHGMQKKTAVAAAVIHAPRLLFLDEPFEGIDAIAGRAIRDVLKQMRKRGTTIFFSSHILEVVERLCTRVTVISEGHVVAEGSIAELRERANAGDQATLEDLFLSAVGASGDSEGKLSWLD